MKPKLFVFCSGCGDFDKDVRTKKDLYKFCPMCGEKLRGVKIPLNQYLKDRDQIKTVGINMWFGIESMFNK